MIGRSAAISSATVEDAADFGRQSHSLWHSLPIVASAVDMPGRASSALGSHAFNRIRTVNRRTILVECPVTLSGGIGEALCRNGLQGEPEGLRAVPSRPFAGACSSAMIVGT